MVVERGVYTEKDDMLAKYIGKNTAIKIQINKQ